MYDNLKCEYPLPGSPPACFCGAWYQTKDLDCTLDSYTITAAGGLTCEDGADHSAFTGAITFYTDNVAAYGPGVYTSDGEDARHVEYRALFANGKLTFIEETENRSERAAKHNGYSFHHRSAAEIDAMRARETESLLGRTLYVWWGGQDEGYSVTVIAESEHELVVQQNDQGRKFEILCRSSRDTTFFDSLEDGRRDKEARAAHWQKRTREFEAEIAAPR